MISSKWNFCYNFSSYVSSFQTLSVKTNFLEYVKKLMASQLESEIDLHDDMRQATNVSTETSSSIARNNRVQKKDACTQTFNGSFLNSKKKNMFIFIYLFLFCSKVSREEKSLGIMCQKFLMLFLTSEVGFL